MLSPTWDNSLDVHHQVQVGLSCVAVNSDKSISKKTTRFDDLIGGKKHSGLLPTTHRFQDLAAPTLGWKVDLPTNVPALRNQMQDLTTPAHRPGQEVSIITVRYRKKERSRILWESVIKWEKDKFCSALFCYDLELWRMHI